ncbi:MAG: rod shape-determining protein MreD [Deltaproteobacteria bacterium]|nr:rod shape-determining protein MreD [Deltaproteobacteria bacterium]
MKEFLLFLPLTAVYLAFKSTLFVDFPVPDLPLIIVFFTAYRRASLEGAVLGFVLGYMDDAFNGGIIGSSSFALVFIFLAVHLLAKKVHFSTPALRAGGVAAATLVKGVLTYAVLRFANADIFFFTHVILYALVTGICAPPVIAALVRLAGLVSPQKFKDNAS